METVGGMCIDRGLGSVEEVFIVGVGCWEVLKRGGFGFKLCYFVNGREWV